MDDTFDEAKLLFEMNDLVGSLKKLNRITMEGKGNCDTFLLSARIHYKMQNWGDAMNDYYSLLELNPENQEAKTRIEMAKSILGYFTPDMFNP